MAPAAQAAVCYCPQCGRQYKVKTEKVGKRVACKDCQEVFVLREKKDEPIPVVAVVVEEPQEGEVAEAPIPVEPHEDPDAPIPLDDTPIPLDDSVQLDDAPIPIDDVEIQHTGAGSGGASHHVSSDEKAEIQASGHYYVAKIIVTGGMAHVNIEKTLNEHAQQGWFVKHMFLVNNDLYAVMDRDKPPLDQPETAK